MSKKKRIIIIIATTCLIVSIFVWRQVTGNPVDYQMHRLEVGDIREKMIAADFLGEKEIAEAVPLLIMLVDDESSSTYKNKSPESLSCVVTIALGDITKINIGDTCCYNEECQKKNSVIINAWKNWYKNDYPKWLESQNSNKTK